jgi:hypothetical protein
MLNVSSDDGKPGVASVDSGLLIQSDSWREMLAGLENGSTVTLHENPEARKRGGVYYTPAYVVRYIVDRTLAPCLDGKSPRDAAHLKILDPACGAGVFLVEAYQRLLDWHLNWYVANAPSEFEEQVRQDRNGCWRLTARERKRILLDNIHGVDLDAQAVEASRLSLLLKLLQDEDAAVEGRQSRLFHELTLRGLEGNVQCGNSLIQSDMPQSTTEDAAEPVVGVPAAAGRSQPEGCTPADISNRRLHNQPAADRPFDYATNFPLVFGRARPGFDAIVGNPPYISVRLLARTLSDDVRDYLSKRYRCATGLYDMYVLFVERAYELLRQNGCFGMIVPNKIAALDYARPCRDLLKRQTTIEEIADVSALRVFGSVGVYPYLLFWQKAAPPAGHLINVRFAQSIGEFRGGQTNSRVLQDGLSVEDGFAIHGWLDVECRVPTEPLSKLATIHSGTTGFAARQMAESLVEKEDVGNRDHHEFIVSRNIDRYRVDLGNVRFQRKDYLRPVLPTEVDWLTENKRRLYGEKKLMIAGMTKRLEIAFDFTGLALGVQVYAASQLQDDPHYLLGILNSKLISYLFRQRFAAKHLAGGYLAVNKGPIEKIPIRRVEKSQTDDWKRRNRLIKLAAQMIVLQQQVSDAVTEKQRGNLEREIAVKDRQIDDLVFDLYDVTSEERKPIDAAMENI